MTAALYARRASKTVLVFEKENIGGQIVYAQNIENYPALKNISGSLFASELFEQVEALGADFEFRAVTGIRKNGDFFIVNAEKKDFSAKSIIIASGVKHRRLGVDKEEQFIGGGVSYCAVCDGAFFKNKDVAVVGGGNTALADAITLQPICKKVYLIHRRDTFRGEEKLVEYIKKQPNIELVLNSNITALLGETFLEGIQIKNNKTRKISSLILSGLFVAVGQEPSNHIFSNLVALDENGFISSSESCTTSCPGIFVAGDCRAKEVRQLSTAAADGAIAALCACKYQDI
jgi:thioredoxin reductase (NADPH)